MKHLLDQPIWNALTTGNHNLALGTDTVKYFDKRVAPFADVEGQHPENFKKLYDNLADRQNVIIFSVNQQLDPGPYSLLERVDCLQMIYNKPAQKPAGEQVIRKLESADIPAMLELTAQTQPGPFLEQTIEFGHYHGIFDHHRLVSMAGQRFHPGTYAEISAVCTQPDFLGRGFARHLILHQIKRIMENGEVPFLHVKCENRNAIKLYESIGFEIRSELFVYILKR